MSVRVAATPPEVQLSSRGTVLRITREGTWRASLPHRQGADDGYVTRDPARVAAGKCPIHAADRLAPALECDGYLGGTNCKPAGTSEGLKYRHARLQTHKLCYYQLKQKSIKKEKQKGTAGLVSLSFRKCSP